MRKITHSSSGYEAFQETYRNSMESVKKLIAKYEEAAIPGAKKILSVEEMDTLVDLISWAVDGPEQGVINYDAWRNKCRELNTFLVERGYRPHGVWMK